MAVEAIRLTNGATPLPPATRIVVVDLAGVGYCGRESKRHAVAFDPLGASRKR
jgi:hypothetical protein